MRTKRLTKEYKETLCSYPNFHKTGSIIGMKKLFYSQNALLVRCGDYIYNVTSCPSLYEIAK